MSDFSTGGGGVSCCRTLRWFRVAAAVGVAVLFGAACYCPAVRVGGYGALLGDWQEDYRGLRALLFGWLTLFFGPWLANPVLFLGCVALLRGQCRRTAVLGLVALALGLTARAVLIAPYDLMPPSQGITGLYTGYYLWLGSMVALVVGAAVAGGVARLHGIATQANEPGAPADRSND
jgi:hypothetical protein